MNNNNVNTDKISPSAFLKFLKKHTTGTRLESIRQDPKAFAEVLRTTYDERKSTLRVILSRVIKRVFNNTKTPKMLENLFKPLKKIIESVFVAEKGTLQSKRQYYSKIRKYLVHNPDNVKDYGGFFDPNDKVYQNTIKNLSITREESNQIQSKTNERVFNENANRTKKFIVEDIIELITTLKDGDMFDKIIALQLACGGRSIEPIAMSDYSPVSIDQFEEKTNLFNERVSPTNMVFVKGLSKKTRSLSKVDELVNPLIALSYPQFKDTLKKMRLLIGATGLSTLNFEQRKMKANLLSKSLNKVLNSRIRKLFGNKEMTSHDLRRIYGGLSYLLYADKKATLNTWLNLRLGHSKDNLTTANHYSTTMFEYRNGSPDERNLESRVGVVEGAVEEIKEDVQEIKARPIQVTPRVPKPVLSTLTTTLIDRNGNPHTYRKPKKQKDGKTLERAIAMTHKAMSDGVEMTNFKVRKLGFSSRIAEEVVKELHL